MFNIQQAKDYDRFTSSEYDKYQKATKTAHDYLHRMNNRVTRTFTTGTAHRIIEEIVQQHKGNVVVVECTAAMSFYHNILEIQGRILPANDDNYGWVDKETILVIPLDDVPELLESGINKRNLKKYYYIEKDSE